MSIDQLVDMIIRLVRGGDSPQQAYKRLRDLVPDENALQEAISVYEEKTHRIRTLRDPVAITSRGLNDWYVGPGNEDIFWPALRRYLVHEKRWDEQSVDSIDSESTKIISMLQPPGLAKIDTRGLVVGYVQSGKTANFTAVIAKAADVNYKLFIVLSGITNNLRRQTQVRLEGELVDLNREQWFTLTTPEYDFRPGPNKNVNAFLTDHQQFKLLAVVKKNATVLRRLLRWLQSASQPVLSSCPVLIIDDEADQASINASRDFERRSAINKLLLELLAFLPKSAYIGYTATPFANVFIDPSAKDLYPRDFIVALQRPRDYFGAERIFGRERLWDDDENGRQEVRLDMIRIVPKEKTSFLQPQSRSTKDVFQPELIEQLQEALRYFWLAAAARIVRGQQHKHCTMLIHTSMYTVVHERFAPLVEEFQLLLLKQIQQSDTATLFSLEQQWNRELTRVPASEFGERAVEFRELLPHLSEVTDITEVVIDNSRSQARLQYPEEEKSVRGKLQVVIGGDTLARGLTLEGLTVSFFLRTASAYDTLLQMGRWFGYRPGYADLTRMWMTLELAHWFYDLATVEEEIRVDIRRYQDEGLTPREFAIRVRTHPSMSITSELKMQAAVEAQVGFNNTREQTILFRRLDAEWLYGNIVAVRNLVSAINNDGIQREQLRGESWLFQNVPSNRILDFLGQYQFHEARPSLSSATIGGYIQAQNKHNDLLHWNIVVRTAKNDQPILELGPNFSVHTIVRSRRNKQQWFDPTHGTDDRDADIGVLMSRGDRVMDLDLDTETVGSFKDDELQDLRPPGIGLLIIYPISKDSPAREQDPDSKEPPMRLPMAAANHLMGLGLVFPKSQHFVTHTYMTVDLSNVQREESEWDYDEENDEK